jgi:hypothetical protein
VRGDLEDLLRDPRHRAAQSAYCQIALTDKVRPMGAMERLQRRFPDTLVLVFEPVGGQLMARTSAASLHRREILIRAVTSSPTFVVVTPPPSGSVLCWRPQLSAPEWPAVTTMTKDALPG